LKKIRLGKIYDYVIKKYDDIVVSDNFVYGNDNNIVVAVSINSFVWMSPGGGWCYLAEVDYTLLTYLLLSSPTMS
jgi:hypothetical protein